MRARSRGEASREFNADDEIDEFLAEQHLPQLTRDVDLPRELAELRHRLRWLSALATATDAELVQHVTVRLTLLDRLRTEVLDQFVSRYVEAWSAEIGLESRRASELETGETERVLIVNGLLAQRLVAAEVGYHLLRSSAQSSPRLLLVSIDRAGLDLIREYEEKDGAVVLPDGPALQGDAFAKVIVTSESALAGQGK